jgi:hypothetical protein
MHDVLDQITESVPILQNFNKSSTNSFNYYVAHCHITLSKMAFTTNAVIGVKFV